MPTWIGHWTIVPSAGVTRHSSRPMVAAVSMHAAHLQRRPKLAKQLVQVLKAPGPRVRLFATVPVAPHSVAG